jgi:uncharacterized protein
VVSSPPPDQEAAPAPAASEPPFILQVSPDKLRADLVACAGFAAWGVPEIKKFLADQGICHGILADEEILSFLSRKGEEKPSLPIAVGRAPKPGKDAEVAYYFDRDPLKIGTVTAGGTIDFKAKGEIPQVKEGFLLAEKTPVVKERDGIDVYGNAVPVERANDILIFPGAGVKTSGDGLKFFAATGGRPELLSDGKIYVLPELKIEGDVGLETGHIDFDGYVNVSGVIQEGFRVRAGRLSAREIHKAEVLTDGDISVDGGIIGAKITCGGNLRARYIHSSQLEVLGNVFVDAEVIDSRIKANGSFMSSYGSGKIFSSHISARAGLEVFQIGSASSRPCFISFNVNMATTNFMNQMKAEILKQEMSGQRYKDSLEEMKKETAHLEKEIGNTAQLQDHALQSERAAAQKIEECRKIKDAAGLAQAEAERERLKAKISSLEKLLDQMMARQDEIAGKIPALKQGIETSERIVEELSNPSRKVAAAPTKPPAFKVNDVLFAGTELEGLHSSLTLQENVTRVLIVENQVMIAGPEGARPAWVLEIKPLP